MIVLLMVIFLLLDVLIGCVSHAFRMCLFFPSIFRPSYCDGFFIFPCFSLPEARSLGDY